MGTTLLAIHCAEGGKKALDRMTQIGYKLPADLRTFELPCTGRVNDVMLMEILQNGVNGIVVIGCRLENCKYLDGNIRAEKRISRVMKLLHEAGIENKLIKLVLIAPDEGKRLYEDIRSFYDQIERNN